MRKPCCLFLLIPLFFVLILNHGCSKSDPPSEGNYSGWAAGQAVNGYGTIVNTQNDGFSWSRQQIPTLAPDVNMNDIHAFDSQTAYSVGEVVNGYGLILRTLNGGITWERVGTISQIPNVELMAVYVIDLQNIWVAGKSNRVLYTTDQGMNWNSLKLDTIAQINFTSITISGKTNIWISGEPVSRNPDDSVAVIMHSADGGITWVMQGLQDTLPGMVHNIFAVDDSNLYAAAEGFIYKSSNGGSKWSITFAKQNKRINAVCAEDINDIWAVGNNDAIYHSTNGGLHWDTITPQVRGNHLLGVTANGAAQKVWIVGSNSAGIGKGIILYTNNDGETWFLEDYPADAGLNKISFPVTK
jgi:photosystem II stability/assembly factor-like uncharacterized protein